MINKSQDPLIFAAVIMYTDMCMYLYMHAPLIDFSGQSREGISRATKPDGVTVNIHERRSTFRPASNEELPPCPIQSIAIDMRAVEVRHLLHISILCRL